MTALFPVDNLQDMTAPELKLMCESRNIAVLKSTTKTDLILMLTEKSSQSVDWTDNSITRKHLRAELRLRSLYLRGTKDDMIESLKKFDNSNKRSSSSEESESEEYESESSDLDQTDEEGRSLERRSKHRAKEANPELAKRLSKCYKMSKQAEVVVDKVSVQVDINRQTFQKQKPSSRSRKILKTPEMEETRKRKEIEKLTRKLESKGVKPKALTLTQMRTEQKRMMKLAKSCADISNDLGYIHNDPVEITRTGREVFCVFRTDFEDMENVRPQDVLLGVLRSPSLTKKLISAGNGSLASVCVDIHKRPLVDDDVEMPDAK